VDIVLLLLLSLMAIASIRVTDVEPPVSQTDEVGSGRLHPLQVAVTEEGRFLVLDGRAGGGTQAITLPDLAEAVQRLEPGRAVEFIADQRSSARLLIEANRAVQVTDREAVFLVELDSEKP
jgi:biopolymer transport protein ExbD